MLIIGQEDCAICELQGVTGLCDAYFTRYYYNVNDFDCQTFVYGGCGGNSNNFETKESCLKRCGGCE